MTARVNPDRTPLPGGGAAAAPLHSLTIPGPARALVAAVVLAVLMHAWVLGLWSAPARHSPALSAAGEVATTRQPAVSVRMRQVAAAPAGERPPTVGASKRAANQASPSRPGPLRSSATPASFASATTVRTPGGAEVAAPALAEPSAPAEADAPMDAPIVAANPPAPPASPAAPAPPTYRTLPPPPIDLQYTIRRGDASGEARITWRVDAEGRYALEMQGTGASPGPGQVNAATALTPHWTSRGTLNSDGVAPERFAVSRRGRERHAANFRRDVGIVSFAGPAATWPLAAGAQDRLSWMVQLAAIFAADPALAAAGRQVSMMVVGAHGDAGLWTFTVQQQVTIEGPGGEALPAWQLQRDSAHAHDPQVQAWLAPGLHHLPIRLRLTLPRSGESTEMHLRALQAP